MLEGVSMAMPCPDNLSLFCCCYCWGNTVSLFNPNVAGLRSGCCCITLLFGFIMFMTETGTGLASTLQLVFEFVRGGYTVDLQAQQSPLPM